MQRAHCDLLDPSIWLLNSGSTRFDRPSGDQRSGVDVPRAWAHGWSLPIARFLDDSGTSLCHSQFAKTIHCLDDVSTHHCGELLVNGQFVEMSQDLYRQLTDRDTKLDWERDTRSSQIRLLVRYSSDCRTCDRGSFGLFLTVFVLHIGHVERTNPLCRPKAESWVPRKSWDHFLGQKTFLVRPDSNNGRSISVGLSVRVRHQLACVVCYALDGG